MTIAVFINNESDAASLLGWGFEFAAADHCGLLVIVPSRSSGKNTFRPLARDSAGPTAIIASVFGFLDSLDPQRAVLKQDISAGTEPSDLHRVVIDVNEIAAPDPASAFADEVKARNVTLLLLPAHQPVRARNDEHDWNQRLFAHAPCEVVVVQGIPPHHAEVIRILVASENENDPDTDVAMRRGSQLARSYPGSSLTLLFVRPDDDWVADQVAQRHLERLAKRVPDSKTSLVKKIQLADSLVDGIRRQNLTEFDLVLIGTRRRRTLTRLFRQSENFDATTTAVAAIRKSIPYSHRIWSRFRDLVRSQVPQLERDERITVVDRLQNSSVFDFDFVALISLSTLIAALGLVRNSGAVVIGAMLVAPLMTPLVAIGFSLVQGNEHLIRRAVKAVLLGFTVALGIGTTVGILLHLFTPDLSITPEMYSRGSPNLLDLIVALASGVAGAYALGRSHLVSAIPGVAIAAALVPPIATSGLSLAMGDLALCGGALLLFATNIVAIVLGTAMTFWAIGINSRHTKSESTEANREPLRWPRWAFLGLVVLSFFLAAEMSYYNPINPVIAGSSSGHSSAQSQSQSTDSKPSETKDDAPDSSTSSLSPGS